MTPPSAFGHRHGAKVARGRIPCATYRLQLHRNFTLKDATELLPYLKELGITDCYASPLFKARPESMHGYDVCGFCQLNPNLGTEADFAEFTGKLKELEMGLIIDLVPNHMGNDLSNDWLVDVFENGQSSPFATYFDIDWQPLKSDLHDKIILPILGDHYAKVLEKGELQLVLEDGTFKVAYYDKKFPVSSQSYRLILEEILKELAPAEVSITGEIQELLKTANSENNHSAIKARVRQLEATSPRLREAIQATLTKFKGKPGCAESFNPLHQLLQQQHYRLAYWKVGPQEINYRRFFDVNELISVKMELPEVFSDAHELVFRWLGDGKVTGLRVDHPDGLWNPKQYLDRLQMPFRKEESDNIGKLIPPSIYVIAEKILTKQELLPDDWQAEGTTGYDFLNRANGIFVESNNSQAFDAIYDDFTGCSGQFSDTVYSCKKKILDESMASELTALTHRLKRAAISTRYGQDFTFKLLHQSLGDIIAAFPVYRTYITEASIKPTRVEEEQIKTAIETARRRNPKTDPAAFDFIQRLLLLQTPEDLDEAGKRYCREFVMKFQQLTSPVMAKGVEDTAFYRYNRFISLNEVGGSPEIFGTRLEEFHQHNHNIAVRWPHTMLTTATHDTKRGEDVRARINVLSEMPGEWKAVVEQWASSNAQFKTMVGGTPAPYKNDEYFLYQTLIGTWPFEADNASALEVFKERLLAYMFKAIREAKAYTTWNDPNLAYEKAVKGFILSLLNPRNAFLKTFCEFQRKVAYFGVFNSLSQVLLRITAPGTPDTYQGAELWDLSMVDPDNRRPVDFKLRRNMLGDLRRNLSSGKFKSSNSLSAMLEEAASGQIKLFTAHRALEFRHQHRALFERGNYEALSAHGKKQRHICAYARSFDHEAALVIVPRLVYTLTGGKQTAPIGGDIWEDTWISLPSLNPGDTLRDAFTNEDVLLETQNGVPGISVRAALTKFPVALLSKA
jgi:(1->4)-alpha-D-glucan 1-alpha-D-glucosylmutase